MQTIHRAALYGMIFCAVVFTSLRAETSEAASLEELRQMIIAQNQLIEALQTKVGALEARLGEEASEAVADRAVSVAVPSASAPVQPVATTEKLPVAPPKPNFLSKYPVQFYGYIKLDAAYDTHRGNNGNIFTYALPMKNGEDDEFSMTARQTRLGLKLGGPEFSGWKVSGRIEGDFYGGGSENSFVPRVRYASITLANEDWRIIAGQDTTIWQLEQPETLNYAQGNHQGALWTRRSQIAVERLLLDEGDNKLRMKVSAGRTVADDADQFGHEDGKDAGFPTIFAALAWETEAFGGTPMEWVIGGHWGRESIETGTGAHVNYDTPLVVLNFNIAFAERLQLFGGIWTGENVDGYGGGIGQGVNLTKGTSIAATGAFAQLQWKATDKLAFHLFGGFDNPKDGDLNPNQRSLNRNVTGTLYYSFIPSLKWGFEYGFTKTDYANAPSASSHRIQSSLIWGF